MKVGILGNMIGASLLQMLARGGGAMPNSPTTTRATTKGHRARRMPSYFTEVNLTTDKRHWADATDPHQAARIEAAAAKRQRKAEKLNRDSFRSFDHDGAIEAYDQKRQPFYIAK